jgi:hypothetical protein
MSDPIIKINPSKSTDLDFEVSVQTNCADDKPCVRFAVELEEEKRWLSLVCIKDEETKKWHVSIPPLKDIVDRAEYPFVLEVIVEDYYFVPAKGTLQPMTAPTVDMTSPKKPAVSVSFTSSADSEKPGTKDLKDYTDVDSWKTAAKEAGAVDFKVHDDKDQTATNKHKDIIGVWDEAGKKGNISTIEKKENVNERAPGAGTAFGGMDAPTNKLLKPEFPPKETHVEEPDEEEIDIQDVASGEGVMRRAARLRREREVSLVTPGDQGMTADTRAQPDGKGEFDAREIASRIVRGTSKAKKPEGKGYLFKRIGEKAVIEGLEPKDLKDKLDEKAKRVKDILKD